FPSERMGHPAFAKGWCEMDANQVHPQPEDYRLWIERAWADLHHSRTQEWSALGVVVGVHLAITQLLTERAPSFNRVEFIAACVFIVIGALITLRHRYLMMSKLVLIFKAEDKLGLVDHAENDENSPGIFPVSERPRLGFHWRKLALPRLLSTSGLILMF
ncbi:MAG: hypothetical protein KJ749_00990, partial [Planctomycetes bacterium]|nr:hypothetical protein [Planctomycetota bacterium]